LLLLAAIFGYSFCRAGQQAFKHLSSNALRVAAINSVGDFVLFLGKALVVVATVLIGIKMFDVSY
jgi:solute carrier family 44 protein 1 (choline transporter-like protein)